jgi:hypothetical protein
MELESIAITETAPALDSDAVAPAKLEDLFVVLDDTPAADTTPEGDQEGAAVGNDDKDAKPTMFNDLAESLGIGLDDLYNLKVTTVDGETVTIEQLKALQGTQDDLAIRELEFEETRVAKEGDLRQAQNELAEIVAALPNGSIKPEVMEKLRAKNATRTQVEQSRTLAAIPAWKDEATRTADMVGMSTHLERFGFPANYLASVSDHRWYVFIRESHLREKRIQNALAKVRAGKPNPTTATKVAAPGKTVAKPTDSNARNGLEAFLNSA